MPVAWAGEGSRANHPEHCELCTSRTQVHARQTDTTTRAVTMFHILLLCGCVAGLSRPLWCVGQACFYCVCLSVERRKHALADKADCDSSLVASRGRDAAAQACWMHWCGGWPMTFPQGTRPCAAAMLRGSLAAVRAVGTASRSAPCVPPRWPSPCQAVHAVQQRCNRGLDRAARSLSGDAGWEAAVKAADASIAEVRDLVAQNHVFIGSVQYFNQGRAAEVAVVNGETADLGDKTRLVVCTLGPDDRDYFQAQDLLDAGKSGCCCDGRGRVSQPPPFPNHLCIALPTVVGVEHGPAALEHRCVFCVQSHSRAP